MAGYSPFSIWSLQTGPLGIPWERILNFATATAVEDRTVMNVLRLPVESLNQAYTYLRLGPGHFLMYVFGRFRLVRSFMIWIYSLRNTTPLSTDRETLVEDVHAGEAAGRIRQDGFFHGLRLRQEVLQQLLSFASLATCFGEGNPDLPFHYGNKDSAERQSGRRFKLGKYQYALLASPVLRALASDPQLLAIAREYLQTEPVLIGARMWWSFAGPTDAIRERSAGQGFHYDIDGYRALAFFFYLTDVGPSNGPHIYVRGSHVKKRVRHLVSMYKSRTDAEIENSYGLERQIVACGPAGSGFAEDIFGFHKGQHPEIGDRLIIQVRYGLRDYGTGRND